MNKQVAKLSLAESREIDTKILQGAVSRASTLSFIFAAAFSAYSLTSFDFLHGFDSALTLFDNTWPRLLFNGLPLLLLAFYLRRFREHTEFKSWIWTLALPLIFLSACLIHVWPLIWQGNTGVYLFVHSANIFILTFTMIVVALPPRLIFWQTTFFVLLFLLPVSLLFLKNDDFKMFRFLWGDFLIAMPITCFVAVLIYQLRLKIALFDLELKRLAAPFLGAPLTDAIYNQKADLLRSRTVDATLIQIDIRGYTKFYRDNDPVVVKSFMTEFHHIVNRFVARHGGYWHKSLGDAHIFSFGAMEQDDDISKIPGTEKELHAAMLRRKRHHVEATIASVRDIVSAFYDLKNKYDVDELVGLGVGIASGEIEIRVQGDEESRKELDIDGTSVIRAARLEEYSKTIRQNLSRHESVVVVSPELALFLEHDPTFRKWEFKDDVPRIRDFEELNFVYYCALSPVTTSSRKIQQGAA